MTKTNEGRYPSKQTPKMKALADQAEKDAAAEKGKKMKKKTNENRAVSNLAFLVESELEKATVVNAAEAILGKLQKMASDLASINADDIMPILDSMRMSFGSDVADRFNEVTNGKIQQTLEAITDTKAAITQEVSRLKAEVNGEPSNDMGMGADDSFGDDDGFGDDAGMGDGMGEMGDDTTMPHDGAEDMGGDMDADSLGLDKALDAAANDSAAGRAKKESVQRNIKALKESANPDRLVFETFRRTLGETRDAVRAARAVANAFAIDFADVVSIVKEGKTNKDEKGNADKKKGYRDERKQKKFERPKDIDEGKTFKDQAGKSDKNKSFTQARKQKKFERPSDLDEAEDVEVDEGKTFKDQAGKSDKNKSFKQERKQKNFERPKDMDESVVAEGEFVPGKKGVKPTFGKAAPKDAPKDDKKVASKVADKKKTDESKGFKTGGVAENARDAVATTRQKTTEAETDHPLIHMVYWYKPKGNNDLPEGGEFSTRDKAQAEAKAEEKREKGYEVEFVEGKKKGVEEAVDDNISSRQKYLDKAKSDRKAKGFGAMADKAKTPVTESEIIASFDGPDGFTHAKGLRDTLRGKGYDVFMDRVLAEGAFIYNVRKILERDGAKTLVMKHSRKTVKPFSKPVKVK